MMPLAFVPRRRIASLAVLSGLVIVSAQAFCTPTPTGPSVAPGEDQQTLAATADREAEASGPEGKQGPEDATAAPTPSPNQADQDGEKAAADPAEAAGGAAQLALGHRVPSLSEAMGAVILDGEQGPAGASGAQTNGELAENHGPVPFDFSYRRRPVPEPRELNYIVAPGETIDEIAERFGVEREDIIVWNRLSRKKPRVRRGQKLKITAQRFPVPKLRVKYKVREDETWDSIAEGYGLSVEELRRQNRGVKAKNLRPGMKLIAWVESTLPRMQEETEELPPWDFATTIPDGAQSRGHPHWGRLHRGIQVPESELYTLRTPKHAYGSSHTLRVLQHSIAAMRHETGYPGEVLVCSLSKRRGGKFFPHKSHQSGRDIDIGLLPYANFPPEEGRKAHGGRVDWAATWALMRQFLETGQVTYIFLSYHLQPKLYEAAKAMGATDEELDAYIQWPRGRGKTNALIRHSKGHDAHFHIRVKCSADEARCFGY